MPNEKGAIMADPNKNGKSDLEDDHLGEDQTDDDRQNTGSGRDTWYYNRVGSAHEPIDQPNQGLAALLELIRQDSPRGAAYIQHLHDDRSHPAYIRFVNLTKIDQIAHEEEVKRDAIRIQNAREKVAALLQEKSDLKSKIGTLEQECASIENDLKAADERAADAAKGLKHILDPGIKVTDEDIQRLRDAAEQKSLFHRSMAKIKRLGSSIQEAAAKVFGDRRAKEEAEAQTHSAAKDEEAAEHLAEIANQSGTRHGEYRLNPVVPVVAQPEEAAAELGVPHYQGVELTDDDFKKAFKDDLQARPLLNQLSLLFHRQNDRRFMSPIVKEATMTFACIVLGTFLGISIAVALDLLTPEQIRSAISVDFPITAFIEAIKGILRAFGAPIPENDAFQAAQILGFTSVGGYIIAKVSRHAIIAAFLIPGENSAFRNFDPDHKNRKLGWASYVFAGLILFTVLGSEIALETSSFKRLIIAEKVKGALRDTGSASVTQDRSKESQDILAQDEWLATTAAATAGTLILSGYLLYSAFEGFIRGRDTVIRSLVVKRMIEIRDKKATDLDQTPDRIGELAGAVSACYVLRSHANLKHRELFNFKERLQRVNAEIEQTKKELVPAYPLYPKTSAATSTAYFDWVGSINEIDKVIKHHLQPEIDALTLKATKAKGAINQAKHEQEKEKKQNLIALQALDDRASRESALASKTHEIDLKNLEDDARLNREILNKAKDTVVNMLRQLDHTISQQIRRVQSKPGIIQRMRNYWSGPVAPPDPDVIQQLRKYREILRELKSFLDDLGLKFRTANSESSTEGAKSEKKTESGDPFLQP